MSHKIRNRATIAGRVRLNGAARSLKLCDFTRFIRIFEIVCFAFDIWGSINLDVEGKIYICTTLVYACEFEAVKFEFDFLLQFTARKDLFMEG